MEIILIIIGVVLGLWILFVLAASIIKGTWNFIVEHKVLTGIMVVAYALYYIYMRTTSRYTIQHGLALWTCL